MEPNGQGVPRLSVLAVAALTLVIVLASRVVFLASRPAEAGLSTPDFPIPASRGSIWDRDGWLLAADRYEYSAVASPSAIGKPAEFAAIVAPVIGLAPEEVIALVADRSSRYQPLKTGLTSPAAAALTKLDVAGLNIEAVARRFYPLGRDAAHITGFVLHDGRVAWGIEASANAVLTGTKGIRGGNYGSDVRRYDAAQNGRDVVLTIDRELQIACAQILRRAVEAERATAGTIIVLDPATGGVLASVSEPSYDPNDYPSGSDEQYLDRAVAAVWEPGSVTKPLTLAAAFEAGTASPRSTYIDEGTIEYAGARISNWDHTPHGPTTMAQLLQYSLNVGAVHVAVSLGAERFYAALADFGFGSPTGIDMNGEEAGIVHWPTEDGWFPGHLATNSFGQGMACTPIQIVTAIGALANDGVLMKPHVVAATVGPAGDVATVAPTPVRRVVSAQTAREVRDLMVEVVSGRVTQAAVPGVSIAGKTGTSEMVEEGTYADDDTIASFVGMLPAERPVAVVLVKLDKPLSTQGSDAAAPVFREVALACIEILGIPRTAADVANAVVEAW